MIIMMSKPSLWHSEASSEPKNDTAVAGSNSSPFNVLLAAAAAVGGLFSRWNKLLAYDEVAFQSSFPTNEIMRLVALGQ